jgi:hypothetical protein
MKILYSKRNDIFGYFKISAIKSDDWVFGEGELTDDFGVLELDLTEQQIIDWENLNKYCVNEDEDDITETPEEYQEVIE